VDREYTGQASSSSSGLLTIFEAGGGGIFRKFGPKRGPTFQGAAGGGAELREAIRPRLQEVFRQELGHGLNSCVSSACALFAVQHVLD